VKKLMRRAPALIVALWFIAAMIYWLRFDAKMRALLGDLAFNLLVDSLILSAAWIIGDKIRRIIRGGSEGIEVFLSSIGLGLGAFIILLFIFGMFGLLYQPLVLALIGLPLVLSVGRIRKILEFRQWDFEPGMVKLSLVEWAAAASFLVVGVFTLLGAMQPEVFFDALYYHIAFPSLYLIRHKIDMFYHAVHSSMPLNVDLLYAMPLAFAGPGAVKLLHIFFFVGATTWIYSLGRRLFGHRAGIAASALWATIPGVHWIAAEGGVDMGVAFFDLGAVSLLLKWVFEREDRRTLILSALFLGLALGSKYTALMVGVVCAFGVIGGAYRRRKELGFRGAIAALLLFGAISLSVGSPWYVRNWVLRGDPLYPAFSKPGSDGAYARENVKKDSPGLYPLSQTFTKLPADLWMRPADFGPVSRIGLGVWLFVPAFFWGAWRKGAASWIALGFLALYIMWSRSILTTRFLYPGLALGAVLAGGMLAANGKEWKSWSAMAAAFLGLSLLFDIKATVAFYESSPIGPIHFIASPSPPDEALEQYVPHTRPARYVMENLPLAGTKLLFVGETQGYYFQRDYMPVSAVDRHPLEEWIRQVNNPEELRGLLKSNGFTDILLCRHEWETMNKSYGYLTLDARGKEIFEKMIKALKPGFKGRFYEVYAL